MQTQLIDSHFDVEGLVTRRYLSDSRHVHEGQVDYLARENLHNDRVISYVLIFPGYSLSIDLNLLFNFREIEVFFTWSMAELRPWALGEARVHELNNGWSSCHDVGASGQEIDANDALEDTGLARGLAADYHDLGQRYVEVYTRARENLLQFVY